MKQVHPAWLSLAAGLILALAWPPLTLNFILFLAFVPLFLLLDKGLSRWRFLGWVYLAMLIWNAITTWWIWNSTGPGAVAAIMANSLLMCLPWLGAYNINKRLGHDLATWAFIPLWMTFEYIHLNWELSWPWLTLGNAFATYPEYIQWYEYTGTSGGTLWVLVVNVLLYQQIRPAMNGGQLRSGKISLPILLALALPLSISFLLRSIAKDAKQDNSAKATKNIVIVQPNIDPYAKFQVGSQDVQLSRLIGLSERAIDTHTALVIWPETALNLPNGIEEDSIRKNYFLMPVWAFLKKHPQIRLVTGVEGFRLFNSATKTVYSRRIPDTDIWYDSYNSAALLDSNGMASSYHKSKLVPGVETLPSFLRFMANWFEQFGGTTGGYARQDDRTVLTDSLHGFKIAPAICYESIYGEFLTGFVRNGANLLCVITNDGWWGNTAGHKQHLAYARLRAIETRRWVVRSANTGISAVIDPTGKIVDSKGWDEAAVLKHDVPQKEELTVYVRFGDILSKLMVSMAILILAFSTYRWWTGRKQNKP
ncbi:apolipoprotein N-acyltransferase [Flavihumibacter rivuli]|uniref:apolipoprotein N-acyltransferase n=1 Tax=Flavihumibacter rivuli TaxID=2838156 RepID=UPI001BDF3D8E|nr:apolipoprotein N-acyltransferase [Flavihumibacter rivuli]ULQ56773.1 apolipoprotein N-acyltransferase [Flavihumibacter rivuli]